MAAPSPAPDAGHPAALHDLWQLARRARLAEDAAGLGFVAVNETRQVLDYRQSAVWLAGRGVVAVSGLPAPEANTPYGQWLDRACAAWAAADAAPAQVRQATAVDLPAPLAADWAEWLPAHVLRVPLSRGAVDAPVLAGYWLLARDRPWDEAEAGIAAELGAVYGHAWRLHLPREPWRARLRRRLGDRRQRRRLLAAGALVCAFPVRLTVLAPAEVVPRDAFLVRAPLEGVVDRFHVRPNQPVKTGDPLFDLDTTALRTRSSVAGKAFEAAAEEYRQAAQLAVSDDEKGKLELAQRKGRMEERAAELAYTRQLLDRVQVKAAREGLAVFGDQADWLGRAVAIGERVMQLADPVRVEIAIRLPVGDAIELAADAPVTLYLTTAPQYSYGGHVTYAAYKAEAGPDGVVAYKLKAGFAAGETPPRLGLTGTAKLHGSWVPFAYYVLRRPLATARQWLGW